MTQMFSDRSNANRKAKLMISKGEAPASEYKIEKRGEREFEIIWAEPDTLAEPRSPEPEKTGIAAMVSDHFSNETGEATEPLDDNTLEAGPTEPTAAEKRASKAATKATERKAKAEARKARIQASLASKAAAKAAKPTKAPKPPKPAGEPAKHGPRGKYNIPAENGGLPPKPVITSAANQAYQRHIDALAELAEAGKWDEVAAYKINKAPKQSYAKMLSQYHDRLLAYHVNSIALA